VNPRIAQAWPLLNFVSLFISIFQVALSKFLEFGGKHHFGTLTCSMLSHLDILDSSVGS
jgi:hypothetical protein